ncbi:hypothetical protein SAMN06269117_11368 [Balnearium lithotrophicum]|uniref:Uncharacterized protein n=1 Tax=Balnearium lithotrophicum TaxID=223788 RepID=A0A521CKB3_9BACT|nr:hypothetical protein [Balnearium lithotrophicum]SMO59877.1 hypothetical protein SAMN06269117_11368 [Balnearium lithotrophicum]
MGVERVLKNMLDGTLTITVNGQGVKVVVEDQGICAVYTADTVEEALKKASTFDPMKLSSKEE